MRWVKPLLLAMAAAVALLVGSDVVFAQCAMCRTALLSSPEGQRMASGFTSGILFLLSAPFVVVGVMAVLISKAHLGLPFRRGAGQRDTALSQFAATPGRSR
ncbi:MAG: hypothetical protein ACE5MH_08300 [Terriglobia bacterium]